MIEAVLTGEIGNVSSLVARALVLEEKKEKEGFKEQVEALSRVMNIAVKLESEPVIKTELFENKEEQTLYEAFVSLKETYAAAGNEAEQFELLAALKPQIESFFDCTMVMAEDQAIRHNRLSLMKELSGLISSFAQFNKILSI